MNMIKIKQTIKTNMILINLLLKSGHIKHTNLFSFIVQDTKLFFSKQINEMK